jgi:hypothetical protein
MRIHRVVAGAIALALSIAAPASAESPYDFVAGGGQTAAGDQFGFSAHDGPTGPQGYVTYTTATFDLGGTVTCINARSERVATLGIIVEHSSDPALIGQGVLIHVQDRDAVSSSTAPDLISYDFVARPLTRRCTAPRVNPFQAVEQGNIVVEDSAGADPPEELIG